MRRRALGPLWPLPWGALAWVLGVAGCVGSGEPAPGVCWLQQVQDGTCRLLLKAKVSRDECCASGEADTAWSNMTESEDTMRLLGFLGFVPCVPCKDSCEGVKCEPGRACRMLGGRPRCECAPDCSRLRPHRRVCGSDGATYRDECDLLTERCRGRPDLRVDYPGPCRGSRASWWSARRRSRAWWTRPAARTAWCAARSPAPCPPRRTRSSAAKTTSPTCPRAICARPPASWAGPSACATWAAAKPPRKRYPRSQRRTSCEPGRPALDLAFPVLFIASAESNLCPRSPRGAWSLHGGHWSWRRRPERRTGGGGPQGPDFRLLPPQEQLLFFPVSRRAGGALQD